MINRRRGIGTKRGRISRSRARRHCSRNSTSTSTWRGILRDRSFRCRKKSIPSKEQRDPTSCSGQVRGSHLSELSSLSHSFFSTPFLLLSSETFYFSFSHPPAKAFRSDSGCVLTVYIFHNFFYQIRSLFQLFLEPANRCSLRQSIFNVKLFVFAQATRNIFMAA